MHNSTPSCPSSTRLRTVIESRSPWFRFDFWELWQYRYLIALFVYRDFVVHYKQTILGPIWWLLQPLMTTGVFIVVFTMIANMSTDEIPAPLFYLAGVVVWNFFSQTLLHTSRSFLDYKEVFRKVYFPRMVIPIAATLSNVMRFVLQLGLFFGFYVLYLAIGTPIRPHWTIVLFPGVVLYVAVMAAGLGILIASLTAKYRDLEFVVPFFTQLWMFASVVMYPLSQVSPKWQFYLALNPLVPIIELFRYMFLGNGTIIFPALLCGIAWTTIVFLLGMVAFNRAGRTFIDTI